MNTYLLASCDFVGLAVIPFTSPVTRSHSASYILLLCATCVGGSVPEPSHAVTQLLGADALSELFSHGFVGPETAASENSPKGSICCVLIAVHQDPLQMWQFKSQPD